MSVAYLDALRDELADAGIRGTRRERIMTEFADPSPAIPRRSSAPCARCTGVVRA